MTVLAIDPGPIESAFVCWDGEQIGGFGKVLNLALLNRLRDQVWGNAIPIVIEMIASYGMPVGKEVFETCAWIGRYTEAVEYNSQSPVVRLSRGDVKMHLCHSMKAKDSNIRQALIDRFGAPGTKKSPGLTYGLSGDTWAAFALAVTWWDRHGAAAGRVG